MYCMTITVVVRAHVRYIHPKSRVRFGSGVIASRGILLLLLLLSLQTPSRLSLAGGIEGERAATGKAY